MSKTADVVIIGGGIIGLSAAFQLARKKFGKIIVVEKEMFLGAGATGKCAGGVRAQFSTKVNIEMSMLSEKMLVNFEQDSDYPAVFDQVGYMFVLSDEQQVADYTKSYELQRSLGLNVEMINPEDVKKIAPAVRTDDLLKATICMDDGLADPNDLIQGYASASRKLGVEIEVENEVTGLKIENGKIISVVSGGGEISTSLVLNAAGPQARLIGQMAGIDIPVEPVRRQIVTSGPLDYITETFPMVVDVKSGLYCHKESSGLLMGWADKDVEPGFDESMDPDYTDNILMRALDRIPQLETAEIAKGWAGLYETTPDHHAIIGWAEGIEGLYLINGFSGHGLMHAPAASLVGAEEICGEELSIDISALAPNRFTKGGIVEETNVI